MNIEHAMQILGLKTKCSVASALKMYRRLALERHPDLGGSQEAFVELTDAYNLLTKEFEGIAEDGNQASKAKTVDGRKLSDLGHGYPITVSATTCERCDGKGYVEFTGGRDEGRVDCPVCGGVGLRSYPCNRCGGDGKYKVNGVVRGECNSCRGSGRFYPKSKEQYLRYNPWGDQWWHRPTYIPGTKFVGIPCSECFGEGTVIRFHKVTGYATCYACEGIGEIRIYNPVLPRGLFANGK